MTAETLTRDQIIHMIRKAEESATRALAQGNETSHRIHMDGAEVWRERLIESYAA